MSALFELSREDLSLALCGEAGQGLQTVETLFIKTVKLSGYNVYATKEYMSRIRGGANSSEVRIASKKINAFVDRIDILVPFTKGALERLHKRISDETLIIGESETINSSKKGVKLALSFAEIAKETGNVIYTNMVVLGFLSGLLDADKEIINRTIDQYFSTKGKSVAADNTKAARRGYEKGESLLRSGKITINLKKNFNGNEELLLNGAESIALGAIAGGCNFIAAYPMSPSTAVFTFLAKYSNDFDIIVEQAEDEIAAINMGLGAWYAGGRALASTSGGGFALMEEGVSLAGMIESPLVVHIAQRPGPATGLPTRTEQGDLELALYSGHGEFPRVILAPGNIEEAFYLTQRAFNLADKYQVPVFILTDQHLIDSYYDVVAFNLDGLKIEKHIVKTEETYRRYEITDHGVSPRGIPGYGEGLVAVDSDEHNEKGHITENLDLRIKMVDKRLGKMQAVKNETIPPEKFGNEKAYRVLVIGWGSTRNAVREALGILDRKDILFLHYRQVFPLHDSTRQYLEKALLTLVIENNATSQFGRLIKQETGIEIDQPILKYNGLPFSVEEVVGRISAALSGRGI